MTTGLGSSGGTASATSRRRAIKFGFVDKAIAGERGESPLRRSAEGRRGRRGRRGREPAPASKGHQEAAGFEE